MNALSVGIQIGIQSIIHSITLHFPHNRMTMSILLLTDYYFIKQSAVTQLTKVFWLIGKIVEYFDNN